MKISNSASAVVMLTIVILCCGSGVKAEDKKMAAKDEKKAAAQPATAAKSVNNSARVTGIGGVFFRSKTNQKALADWYKKNLGMPMEEWGGSILRWADDKAEDKGVTVWHAVEDSKFFSPSKSEFMINYRIDNMDLMLKQLKKNGVKILKGPESHENGKFLWLQDPDGNKVELWEPKIWDEKNKKL